MSYRQIISSRLYVRLKQGFPTFVWPCTPLAFQQMSISDVEAANSSTASASTNKKRENDRWP